MENDIYDGDFVIWKLKEGFDDAIITESDISYYKKQKLVSPDTTVIVVTSEGKVRDVHWPKKKGD